MAKSPDKPKKPKNPARATRAKAARPDQPVVPDQLADLLNPAIKKGTAGIGSGTGPQHMRVTSPQGGEVGRGGRGGGGRGGDYN
jgi:excinuclease ABC subunit B